MPPHSFRLEKSSGFCHPASIPTRPSFLGCHNWRQISGVLEGRWRFTESLGGPGPDLPTRGDVCNDSARGAMSKIYVMKVEDTYRVAGTRISLDSLVYLYREGISPEGMVESYPTLTLEQVHGALAYYLANQKEIDHTWRGRTQSPSASIKSHGEVTQN